MLQPFTVTWDAPEYEHRPKEISWYWISIIVSVILIAIAVWQQNWLFVVFIVIAEVLVLFWGDRSPDMIPITVNEKGVRIGEDKFYERARIAAFSIVPHEHTNWFDLVFHLDRRLLPNVIVKIPHDKAHEVHQRLSELYAFFDYEESFVETLERFFGF
jgi:hypothetical protein